MKEITAIIRMNKMNVTKRALAEVGGWSLTARKVVGRGKGKVDYLLLKGAEAGYDEAISQLGPGPKLIPKRMLTLVVPDNMVDAVVKTIIEINQTGSPGDGKIFVQAVTDAIRIRTGETGEAVLDTILPANTEVPI
ncbi:MAG: P-II family nitrogen regulator [Phycisphaerales bacterium]|nr:P-II family nitrogen regulator [Phycisphaerales bacterium]